MCGNFILFLPNSVRKGKVMCRICQRIQQDKRCTEIGYTLLNKLTPQTIQVVCNNCSVINIFQSSNLMRNSVVCKNCSKKDAVKSYCYIFKLIVEGIPYIKLGKSNNPYLRSLNFLSKDVKADVLFINKSQFISEALAYEFERQLRIKYKHFITPKEIAKNFMNSGFSEVYTIESLDHFLKEFDEKNKN
jgi:hypothetical protein